MGLSFEEAWLLAVRPGKRMVLSNTRDAPPGCVRWPTDSGERVAWRNALIELRDVFRRAYQGRPMTVREESAVKLALVLDAGDRLHAARGIEPVRHLRSVA